MTYVEKFRFTQEQWDNMHPGLKANLEDNPVVEVIIDG
jgi:hypothetical protein|tara:strand:+ start:1124 stop:1237 length:114 start_codon:yes stop_codon:yes gene_type:complete